MEIKEGKGGIPPPLARFPSRSPRELRTGRRQPPRTIQHAGGESARELDESAVI